MIFLVKNSISFINTNLFITFVQSCSNMFTSNDNYSHNNINILIYEKQKNCTFQQ